MSKQKQPVGQGPKVPAFMSNDREHRLDSLNPNREIALGFSFIGNSSTIQGFASGGDANPLYDRNLTVCPTCHTRRTFFEFGFGRFEHCAKCRRAQ